SFSPDGKYLSFAVLKDSSYSLRVLSLDQNKVQAVTTAEMARPAPPGSVFSPDSRWLAFRDGPSSAFGSAGEGVFVVPIPMTSSAEKYQAPKLGRDFHPVWGPNGRELIYVPSAASGQLAVVPIATRPSLVFGKPVVVPARVTDNRGIGAMRAYDILRDGRFI